MRCGAAMSRRGGTVAVLAIVALALVVSTALLLFERDEMEVRRRQADRLAPETPVDGDGPGPAAPPPPVPEDGAAATGDGTVPPEGDAAPADALVVECLVQIEGGFGLHGVTFLDMERYDDGSLGAWLEEGPNDGVESGEDGRVTLRWVRGEAPILVAVLVDKMEFVRVDGAARVETTELGPVVEVDRTGPRRLKVVFKDPEGARHLRFTDATSGQVLRFTDDLQMIWRGRVQVFRGSDGESEAEADVETATEQVVSWERYASTGKGGWIPVRMRPGVETGVEIRAPGYRSRTVAAEDIGARTEVALEPVEAGVTGTLELVGGGPPLSSRLDWVQASLRPRGGGPDSEVEGVHGLPTEAGEFTLWEVPDGQWTLHVAANGSAGVRHASVDFRRAGAPVDLGTVIVDRHAGIRLRVLDADGKPVSRQVVSAAGVSSAPGEGYTLHRDYLSDHLRGATDDEGRVTIDGLRPGTAYRILFADAESMDFDIVAPAQNGAFLEREVRWNGRMVDCTFRVTVGGEVPDHWGAQVEGPWPLDISWQRDNAPIRVRLRPGRHVFRLLARKAGDKGFSMYRATVEVPDEPAFDADLDLK